jgi:DNA polymerase-3 subunit epsilon
MNSFPVKLDRPLIVFDIEATGTSPRADRIIELAAIRIEPDGTEVNGYWLLNPEMSIPEDSIAIHGITNDIVKDCPTFKAKALEILRRGGFGWFQCRTF